jgi:UDP-2,3-diacylglucosamine hydrolase
MKQIFIIADIHLGDTSLLNPEKAKLNFIKFLTDLPNNSVLFILGDLFNFFLMKNCKILFGDTDILRLLYNCTKRGINISIFSGNHDFWIGNFLKKYNINFIRFNKSVCYRGKRILLSHGDLYFNGSKLISLINLFSKTFIFYIIVYFFPEDLLKIFIRFISKRERNLVKIKNPYIEYCRNNNKYDIFIFGHYHTTDVIKCNNSYIVVPGDFATKYTYIKILNDKLYIIKNNNIFKTIKI